MSKSPTSANASRIEKNETKKIAGLIRRAEGGDKAALSTFREIFDTKPEVWEEVGNLARQAEHAMVNATAGGNEVLKAAVYRKLREMKEELAGPAPTRLERLLVERVVVCWLHVHYADITYAQRMKDLNREWGDFYQRRQDRAQRRYLSAIRTLAQVRRLLIPAVQVNIGAQQTNVAKVAKSGST